MWTSVTFTKHNVSEADPFRSMYQYFIPFYGYIITYMKCNILFIHLLMGIWIIYTFLCYG